MSEEFKKIVRLARGDENPPDAVVVDPEQPERRIPTLVEGGEEDDLAEWFREFDAEHPEMYEWFVAMARHVHDQGHRRYAAKTIMERLRHESPVRFGGEYKIPNDYKDKASARYARKFLAEYPSFEGFFETRKLTNARRRKELGDAHKRRPDDDR